MPARPPSPVPDPLALPPVPPPAPDDHRWRDRVVVALFALALALPLAGAVRKRGLAATAFENRATEPWPGVPRTPAAARAWPAAFEAAFADRFGGRDGLNLLHHGILAGTFGVSPAANVLIGRDGWLFFLGEDGKSIDRDYRGVAPYPATEPQAVAAELARRHAWLAARGIPYVAMIVPDKATIYPEHLPDWARPARRPSRLDRVYAALAAHPGIAVLDLRPALVAGKTRERQYYATDSHWNSVGAAAGYAALSAALQARVPAYPAVPPERAPFVAGVDYYSGDLARMIGVPKLFREDDIAPLAKVLAGADRRCARRVDDGTDRTVEIWSCDRPELPTAVIYRDSMAVPLVPMLAENFRRVVFVTGHGLDPALIERERPDVVVEEMVERAMHTPAASPLRQDGAADPARGESRAK
jgi:hypothetical protein